MGCGASAPVRQDYWAHDAVHGNNAHGRGWAPPPPGYTPNQGNVQYVRWQPQGQPAPPPQWLHAGIAPPRGRLQVGPGQRPPYVPFPNFVAPRPPPGRRPVDHGDVSPRLRQPEQKIRLRPPRKREMHITAVTQEMTSAIQSCLNSGTPWDDPDFPAAPKTIDHRGKSGNNIQWKRPQALTNNPRLLVHGVSTDDVCQGTLGDCWFLSACASIARESELMSKVIPKDQYLWKGGRYAGVAHFRFWRFGAWQDVYVDDNLPTVHGRLTYARCSDNNEFWLPLIEKAYAKLNGSYAALISGQATDALTDLTGGICEKFKTGPQEEQILYKTLLKAQKRGSFMTCSTKSTFDEGSSGLVSGHAYTITGVAKIRNFGKTHKLLRIRNPWGRQEWTGAWSDGSPEWQRMTGDVLQRLGYENKDDGEFWMEYGDFFQFYREVTIASLGEHEADKTGVESSWCRIVLSGAESPWCRVVLVPSCPGAELSCLVPSRPGAESSRCRVVLVPSRPGAESSWCRVVLVPSCPGAELSWCRIVLSGADSSWCRVVPVPSRPGAESSRCRVVLVPSRPGAESSWCRVVLVPSCPGAESSWCRVVPVPSRPSAESSRCRVVLVPSCPGAESSRCRVVLVPRVKSKWDVAQEMGEWKRGETAGGCRNHMKTYAQNPQYLFTLSSADDFDPEEDDEEDRGTCAVLIGLMQELPKFKKKLQHIGFQVYQVTSPDRVVKLSKSQLWQSEPVFMTMTYYNNREVTLRIQMDPGTYVIIPTTHAPNIEGPFLLRVFTERPVQLRELGEHCPQPGYLKVPPRRVSKPDRPISTLLPCYLVPPVPTHAPPSPDALRRRHGRSRTHGSTVKKYVIRDEREIANGPDPERAGPKVDLEELRNVRQDLKFAPMPKGKSYAEVEHKLGNTEVTKTSHLAKDSRSNG
ncbi:CAPN9 [Branchiostoma lanceolatum]|uniref:CAPN9 protein n=1 Tax=Branchiostoma lanceolatum TaxID=7740 RepID=A0A8K0EYQ6_BRALA|nr:CAPN9 [Branchiostoma lanceolatum]